MQPPGFSLRWFLFSFRGRIGRSAYWAYTLAAIVLFATVFVGGAWVTQAVAGDPKTGEVANPAASSAFVALAVVFMVVYIWSNYAVHAKRWHDRNKSGWWSLIGLVPYIGGIWLLVECGFLKGTDGPNRFGPDPRGGNLVDVFD